MVNIDSNFYILSSYHRQAQDLSFLPLLSLTSDLTDHKIPDLKPFATARLSFCAASSASLWLHGFLPSP